MLSFIGALTLGGKWKIKDIDSMKEVTKETYLSWYKNMLFWRKFEDKLAAVYIQQKVRGFLHLYNPSNTTFVKHYHAFFNCTQYQDYSTNYYVAGYGNTTSAIDAVQFQMSSGNIDAGDICLYGIL